MESKKEHINVSVRIRPVLSQDSTTSSSLQIISTEPPVLIVVERAQTYSFDNIFPEDADQEKVYNDAVKPFVDCVKKGYNCTVFAYGQTGTGKTYTMGSGSQKSNDHYHTGIIPRALEQLFNEDNPNSDEETDVYISFSEIYNEKVFDLLQPNKKTPLPVLGFVVQQLSMKRVRNVTEAKELLELGNKIRHVGETKQNANSSRSHAIFTINFTRRNSSYETNGKLNLVDLAGSESVRKTGSRGSTFTEGININKGLLSIGQVISALSMKSSYIPYRQSTITSILQGSLNVDNYISLIACVSANPDDITESLQTLDFAQRTKKVRNNPEVNQVLAKYKKENPNAFGAGRTPMKRPNSTPLKTPAIKRLTVPLLPLINESAQSQISNIDSSNSQFSINISSSSKISTAPDITQQTLSPVIRKYMTKMEDTIINHMETVIMRTLRRPTRALLQAKESCDSTEKENTPNLRWSKLQNEVSKMVQNELAQMSVKTTKSVKTVRATSSPIEGKEKLTARRLLEYDSPDANTLSSASSKSTPENQSPTEFSFKKPELPLKKKKTGRQPRISSISPIDNEMPKPTPRRSVRLSMKKANTTMDNSFINMSEVSFDSSLNRNRFENSSLRNDDRDCEDSPAEVQSARRISRRVKKNISKFSPGWTLTKKRKNIGFIAAKTPSKMLVERALRKHKNSRQDSPYTAHSKKVLNVLNRGTQRELEKLHLIGAKTAEQILLFRTLRGSFSEVEDLSKIPGWGTKKYEKFVASNLLTKE